MCFMIKKNFLVDSREPFKLKEVMICYNIIATLMSAYIGLNLIVSAIALRYNLFCQASRPIWTPHEINVNNISMIDKNEFRLIVFIKQFSLSMLCGGTLFRS